jgi:RNA polymerase sigma-70 factor (ECF subfamily)
MNATEYQHEAQRLRPQLQAEARRYLQDADEAEDVVQDVLLKLWLMREEVALPMDALAKVLVRNRCIDRLRRLRLPSTSTACHSSNSPTTRRNASTV